MHRVLAPLVRSMGVDLCLDVVRPGYVPGGAGIIEMTVVPRRQGLDALVLSAAGRVCDVHGIALSSHLAAQRVSERIASTCETRIRGEGMACAVDRMEDDTAVHAGACLAIWAKGSTGSWFGTTTMAIPDLEDSPIKPEAYRQINHVARQLIHAFD